MKMLTHRDWQLVEAWREDDEEWRVPDSPLGWAIIRLIDEALESGDKP